ncbi:MAG: formylglycine-generating enzyme family protein [Lachnospiraceae bacterium]|nr:formylglycine-generating enzyme family protein [Lachnospiraceae bacterium]
MADYDISNFALKACCPSNELLYDDKGLPSVMVKIPKFKLSEVLDGGADEYHPAFIVNGSTLDYIYISKYQNVVENGRAYSKPGVDPQANISWTNAKAYCEAKGEGWHLMTAVEYAAIALWCKKNGFMPYGNNNYGKDSRETLYKAIPATYDSSGNISHVLTGTGPLTWSHNGEPDGIWDINGNVSEWAGAKRTVYGEIQFLVNNNGADLNNDQGASSAEWMAIDASTGEFVTPDGSGTTTNTIKVDNVSSGYYGITVTTESSDFSFAIGSATCTSDISDAAKATLRAYGLLPEDGSTAADYDNDRLYWNNAASERMFGSGGYFSSTTYAGVFYGSGISGTRTITYTSIGFRSAYAPLPTA